MPRPRSRRATRVVLPALVIIGVLGVGAYAAWRAFAPLPDVWVMPVVSRPTMRLAGGGGVGSGSGSDGEKVPGGSVPEGAVLATAPGWVEPDPYGVTVSALTEGVVTEVLALEGQRVEAGQVVARLDATSAKLALRRAEAERDAAHGDEAGAIGGVQSAETRVKELEEDFSRERRPVETTASGTAPVVAPRESAQRDRRTRLVQETLVQARAVLEKASAQLRAREVIVEQAALDLARREVRSPVSGVVLDRLVEPGMYVGMSMGSQMSQDSGGGGGGMAGMPGMKRASEGSGHHTGDMSGAVLRLYDPQRLQVRTEVAVADSVKIRVGMAAQMTTDAAPDVAFRGTVTRIVPAADQQKNTVEVKVVIENSEGVLRPGMQMRVKFFMHASAAKEESARPMAASTGGTGAPRVMVPSRGLRDFNGNKARFFVVGPGQSGGASRVEAREVTIVGEPESGYVEVSGSASLGERVVVRAQSNIEAGDRVHVVGELSPAAK